MSRKPLKKSDLGKRWLQPRRDNKIKIKPEYHLIITEGKNTEPAYFKAIRDTINRSYRERIQLEIIGEGENTLNLLEKAKARARRSPNEYKHVWIVYDTDDFPAKDIDETASLCKKTEKDETVYHAIWSNQCIELWFLLHFSYMHSDLHRVEYWPKLSEALKERSAGTYAKDREDMFSILRPNMQDAISNAKKLDAENKRRRLPPSKAAPGTKIYELIEKLQPYLSE